MTAYGIMTSHLGLTLPRLTANAFVHVGTVKLENVETFFFDPLAFLSHDSI